MCDICATTPRFEVFDENGLFHYMKCERINLCKYLTAHLRLLHSDGLSKIFVTMLDKFVCTPVDVFGGNCGGVHNKFMKFSLIPTLQFLENIMSLCESAQVYTIEEMCAGCGLFSELLREYGKENHEKIKINATDGMYDTYTSVHFCDIAQKDIADFICDQHFNQDACYIVINLTNYSVYRTKYETELQTLITSKKPKIFMVVTDAMNVDKYRQIDKYTTFRFYPNVVSKFDDKFTVLERQTEMCGKIYIREDVNISSQILENFISDGCAPIAEQAKYIVREMIRRNNAPEFLATQSEAKLLEIVRILNNLQTTSVPKFLSSPEEVDEYLSLAQMVKMNFDVMPKHMETREKFLMLKKYLSMIDHNLQKLHDLKVVPKNIVNEYEATVFLVREYFSSVLS